jgi:hypothetical protein
MARESRLRYEQHYTVETYVSNLSRVLNSVQGRNTDPRAPQASPAGRAAARSTVMGES